MQIHLKQREIETALKQFVSQQGINLTGKTIEVVFTSGRKDNGLSAELTIEDAVVQPSTNTFVEPVKETIEPTLEEPATKSSLFN